MNIRMTPKSYIPRLLMEPDDTTTVVEESSFSLPVTTQSVLVLTPINLTNVSAFATQWLQIYDEWRLLKVQFRYHSRSPTSTSGALVAYIERDTTDALVTTLAEGYRQQESQEFRPYDDFTTSPKLTTLEWNPKDPSDFEFQRLPGTAVFNYCVVGEAITPATVAGTIQIISRIQFRGRNPSS